MGIKNTVLVASTYVDLTFLSADRTRQTGTDRCKIALRAVDKCIAIDIVIVHVSHNLFFIYSMK